MESFTPKQGKSLEEDEDFAHLVAISLNNLLNSGILSTSDLTQASERKIAEFIIRFKEKLKRGIFDEKDKRKVKIMFGNEKEETSKKRAGNESKEEIIIKTRIFLQKILESVDPSMSTKIEGVLIFGSKLDPGKKPDEFSDLDMIFLTSTNDTKYINLTEIARLGKHIEKKAQENQYLVPKLGLSEIVNIHVFLGSINKPDLVEMKNLYWAWTQNAYFISKKRQVETYVNEKIRDFMKSDELISKRQEEMEKIKNEIQELAYWPGPRNLHPNLVSLTAN